MWKIITVLVLSFLGLFGVSDGQILQNGQCDDNIQLQANFNIDQFLGTWYEYASAEHPLSGDCSTIEFTRVGEAVTVNHTTVRQNFIVEHFGTAQVPAGTARMTLNLPTASLTPINFWVWVTDFNNFALIYNCENVGTTQRRFYIWKLTRTPTTTEMVLALMNATMINNIGVNSNDLRNVDHGDQACTTLPVIPPGQAVVLPGQCDENIPVVQNFSAGDFLGVWHQIASYYSESAGGTCNRAQYTSQDGVIVDVFNSQIVNQSLVVQEGYATVSSNDSSGRLNVVFEVAPNVIVEQELLILATDYTQWAISYACDNIGNNQKRVYSWIVSRTRQLPPDAQAQVDAVVSSLIDLNYNYYETTDQSNTGCFYVPEVVAGQPAVFGGQCDLNIPVQPNFVAANYLGLWNDIESFPTPFQFGTCANAFYSLGEEGVDVLNTQVVNQTLDTLEGLAIPVGNEAKLIVNFVVPGTNITAVTDYWIISTDYTSYSLVYSCLNINDYQQQVTMWKLSRTKSLTQAANTAINNALATQSVFDARFFQQMDQSREGCFYYPEPNGERVVFPGQCDDEDIAVVQNFNLNLFAGQWFEIETYPKEFQPGECVDHTFTVAGNNSFNLVSTSVVDQLLGVTDSQLVFVNGTDGLFSLSISNGTGNDRINIPYQIVATDYINYALAYSCMDINNDFKAVYSWKLSRTKQLSSTAATAINTTIANFRVLGEEYFELVDQSNDACFYFPDLAPGEPVILPGTCDSEDDLPYIRNFDAAAYLGRWRLIESYPSQFQAGECNQARYSLVDGTVVVYNTDVLNQTLREDTGSGVLVSDANNQTIGKLLVTFPSSNETFALYIFDTDYTNYSLVYGCTNLANNRRQVQSWKMSRTTNLTEQSIAAINAVTSNVTVLNDRYYEIVDHSDAACFYYPATDGSSTVIFPGQCDENINVVTNFDAVGYMGLWHDIERYPAPFQDGTCGNAFYTLLDGPVVDVFNTQVLNQTLDTIIGSAVLDLVDANDTSAKLLVTFPVGDFNLTTPYWVLATDYTSYALVYSCTNLDEERRSVTSWKLGRTKSLTTAATQAINAVVASIDVLDDRYYIEQDQSRDGCFYFPEANGDPVVFPGQCDDENIAVVQNLNLNLFAGQWFEIETYPKEFQPGECVDHTFAVAGNNGFNLVSTSVVNQTLGVSDSQAVFVNGTDGLFTLSISNGTGNDPINIPYQIVVTDYFDYALAYSCMNRGNDFKAIYSWKLSRTKQLSANAAQAINAAIANYTVLAEQYFEPVDQSNDACFYFPDLAPGELVILPGPCDSEEDLPIMRNFDADSYLGRWRLIESYPSRFQAGECNQARYSLSNGTVVVYNTDVLNQTLREVTGSAVFAVDSNNQPIGKLLVTFPSTTEPYALYIFDTDYTNYSLLYGCTNLTNNRRQVQSWKMSRTTSLTEQSIAAINAVTSNVTVLNDRYYEIVDHSDAACFYYPATDGSSTVIFPGQCDENINVVTNFDAVGYMGLWHDIERYPAPFQDGTCGNAFYTLLDGPVVDVFNTQVLNQTLDTIIGSAVLDLVDANDTSAKLLVTFPVGDFNLTTPYWVLATDYTSYALVYSCTNLDEERRSVTSWKLGRTKSLTTAATQAINAVVASIDVLDDRYYIEQDQSRDGCFYLPEANGDPVVFPGQCDDEDIAVVQNLNLNLFAGQWFEIETYPKEFQPGECVDHTFSVAGNNGFNLVSTSVVDQTLGVTDSQAVFVNGTDGLFTLSISNGTGNDPINIPYQIVVTDYFDYALAYSCMNRGNDFKAIYSWKLSRTKQLSANAAQAINAAIANYTVLAEQYFEPVDQSNDACFYFPDLAPGELVILPGPCDSEEDLPIMRNFDADSYLGRWRLIESYPSRFQAGECNQARYSLSNGTVVVYNTDVLNQTLREVTGSAVFAVDSNNQPIGKLLVTFPSTTEPYALYIFDTDYTNYSLLYGCTNLTNNRRQVQSWKMSRTTSLTEQSIAAINAVTSNVTVLNDRYYEIVDHSDAACFYYPATDGSSTVIFPGQCDENINVVTNFDAVGYMGLWHDIERYPAPFQDGTCGNAFYTLLDGPVVDVFNTQVLNQTLDTIIGSAVLDLVDANDTSAKLLVTFPVGDFNLTTPYWVLATDYTSYALVYSCTNLDEERRSVTSWKLGRTKSLTTAATQAINAVVASIDVLDDRYYIEQDQSRDGCFYLPEANGDPVVFPGQCDDEDIAVVQNLNLNLFAGQWFEIETYPKEFQPGECVDHTFSVAGNNGFNLVSTSVVDQTLGVTDSQAVFVNGTDGLFTLSISNGTGNDPINIPYQIVVTDYFDYALAYSCMNRGNDFKAIYSWKLSRTKQLSANAAQAINAAIANYTVLAEQYFEPVDQSNDACFYFPDLAPGELVILPGPCDSEEDLPIMRNFDADSYLGRWRLIESYPSRFQAGECNQARYSLSNGTVVVYNTDVLNQTLREVTGSAVFAVDANNQPIGKLLVTFPSTTEPYALYIFDTDYTNYSLLYGCTNLTNNRRQVQSWKMSRTTSLTEQSIAAINAVTSNVTVLNDRYYEIVDHSDAACFYYPATDGSSTVIFPGQCDENINVVTNFDAVGYMGLWHDIERYPAPFQDGTCGNAFYTLLDGPVVDVFNTQVLNQTLDTIIGSAVLDLVDANDTSAKLLVTFPVGDFNLTTPYWVLATDYTSYALVYSCTNLDEERRSVTSWKLGRTKSLTTAATQAINAVVASIDVLDDRYYIEQDQSRDGCFYFPEANGDPVVFPGQCDDEDIAVVQNLNLNLFAGQWFEIETYPKEFQPGECVDHTFSVAGNNGFNLVSTSVVDQTLGVSDSQAVFVNGTDGLFTLSISNGTGNDPINIPYQIVVTDYFDYALAYSCMNRGNDFKAIYSWKLSRTKQLSANAAQAINAAIANYTVLAEQYFEPVDQSNDACFYFPDLAPGELVILPGPCDSEEDLPIMRNFDADSYLGRWRLIESYPSRFQAGECNQARYSLSNGTVVVYNTDVLNQTLREVTGSAVFAVDANNQPIGKLLVTFPSTTEPYALYIFDTDYTNYSLLYGCTNLTNNRRQVQSWKMSRTTNLTQESMAAINAVTSNVTVLNDRYYEIVNNSDAACFYFPEADGSSPIVFPGQCDENINVVMNFDAVAYAGVWYEIEAYPAPFQGGSCGTANYDLDLNTLVVAVENSQVVNPDGFGPVLDVQTGTAVLALNDTSGKLLVTFEVNGQNITTNYWVLATDYNNYALVYSCQNIDSEYRQVNSWKLSRTRNLTATAETAISNAIEGVQVLEERYYVESGQSEEDCFFYPDNEGGDVILDGLCVPDADVPAITGFNANLFAGLWHEVARFPSDLQEGECTATNYSFNQNNVVITKTEVDNELQTSNIISGSLSADGRGVINVEISGIPFSTMFVLDTDYSEFALLYGCRNLNNNTKQVYSWKFTRSQSGLSAEANARINNAVLQNPDLFENYFETTDQSNDACFHYPEFAELPDGIELLGPCDESIRGVPNFDAGNYLGRWIEIERYPQSDQFGTCDRAYYSLGDGNVLVRNTQVVEQTLAEQLGFAEVASNDGSGLLNVTFVVNGVTLHANYYILATDYNNYSLVYSCTNLPTGSRIVYSWKLSRTTSLNNEAIAAMNAVINQTQGLRQEYYQVTNQSEEACFYVPEVNVNEAPVFRGQCEANVVGMTNFDAARYVGWWHEVERYPVDHYRGECISSQYQSSGSSFLVTDTVVANGSATVTSGTVQITADGRLRRTINGVTQDIWVLATDYETYALLYSCENVDNEYRRVWSAKHSKSRQLTPAAQAAMSPVINANQLLYPQFYQAVDQSDAACFHYPAITGQQVILPGQCDDNIPVVQGFDVEAYEGTWYQIERYPQTHENPTSTCIGARYTLQDSGIVTVLNWEVVYGELMTIEGNATLISTDGSAKLNVVLPVRDSPTGETVTTSLYVLTTDYENFALAYSCSNVNAFQRSIGAWKLSRERTLSPVHHNAINLYMANREELYQDYFVSVAQDEHCEEPSAGALVKSSIVVMLICALWQILS